VHVRIITTITLLLDPMVIFPIGAMGWCKDNNTIITLYSDNSNEVIVEFMQIMNIIGAMRR
jgi:hypothetical protein